MTDLHIDERYKQFAAPRQVEYIDAVNQHGSYSKASQALGVDRRGLTRSIQAVIHRARQQGFDPDLDMQHPVPETHYAKGVSTLYGEDGQVKLQWVKSDIRRESLKETAGQIVDSLQIKPCKSRVKPRKYMSDELLTVYPMGDPHIGMYAWHEETGEDFDLDIAERDLSAAIEMLVSSATPTEEALVVNLGDFFHSDNQEGYTKRSGNFLDVDSRKQKVTQVGVRVMVNLIDTTLKKHNTVRVINEIGNHDDESSFMLSLILDAYYRNEPRVVIDLSPATFHYYKFGKTLIGVTHGHNCKADLLGQIMATDRKEDWGATDHRYWLVGHIHHTSKKEVPGCVVESFRTLAAKDAYHAAHGYRSGRDMHRITYHKEWGEVGREIMGINQIRNISKES